MININSIIYSGRNSLYSAIIKLLWSIFAMSLMLFVSGCNISLTAPTPTSAPTTTPSPRSTSTSTVTPTSTSTVTPTATSTYAPTATTIPETLAELPPLYRDNAAVASGEIVLQITSASLQTSIGTLMASGQTKLLVFDVIIYNYSLTKQVFYDYNFELVTLDGTTRISNADYMAAACDSIPDHKLQPCAPNIRRIFLAEFEIQPKQWAKTRIVFQVDPNQITVSSLKFSAANVNHSTMQLILITSTASNQLVVFKKAVNDVEQYEYIDRVVVDTEELLIDEYVEETQNCFGTTRVENTRTISTKTSKLEVESQEMPVMPNIGPLNDIPYLNVLAQTILGKAYTISNGEELAFSQSLAFPAEKGTWTRYRVKLVKVVTRGTITIKSSGLALQFDYTIGKQIRASSASLPPGDCLSITLTPEPKKTKSP